MATATTEKAQQPTPQHSEYATYQHVLELVIATEKELEKHPLAEFVDGVSLPIILFQLRSFSYELSTDLKLAPSVIEDPKVLTFLHDLHVALELLLERKEPEVHPVPKSLTEIVESYHDYKEAEKKSEVAKTAAKDRLEAATRFAQQTQTQQALIASKVKGAIRESQQLTDHLAFTIEGAESALTDSLFEILTAKEHSNEAISQLLETGVPQYNQYTPSQQAEARFFIASQIAENVRLQFGQVGEADPSIAQKLINESFMKTFSDYHVTFVNEAQLLQATESLAKKHAVSFSQAGSATRNLERTLTQVQESSLKRVLASYVGTGSSHNQGTLANDLAFTLQETSKQLSEATTNKIVTDTLAKLQTHFLTPTPTNIQRVLTTSLLDHPSVKQHSNASEVASAATRFIRRNPSLESIGRLIRLEHSISSNDKKDITNSDTLGTTAFVQITRDDPSLTRIVQNAQKDTALFYALLERDPEIIGTLKTVLKKMVERSAFSPRLEAIKQGRTAMSALYVINQFEATIQKKENPPISTMQLQKEIEERFGTTASQHARILTYVHQVITAEAQEVYKSAMKEMLLSPTLENVPSSKESLFSHAVAVKQKRAKERKRGTKEEHTLSYPAQATLVALNPTKPVELVQQAGKVQAISRNEAKREGIVRQVIILPFIRTKKRITSFLSALLPKKQFTHAFPEIQHAMHEAEAPVGKSLGQGLKNAYSTLSQFLTVRGLGALVGAGFGFVASGGTMQGAILGSGTGALIGSVMDGSFPKGFGNFMRDTTSNIAHHDEIKRTRQALKTAQNVRSGFSSLSTFIKFLPPQVKIAICVVIAVIIVVIIFLFIIFYKSDPNTQNPTQPTQKTITGLVLQKSGPAQVQNGENIVYTITATYTGKQQVIISDPLPKDTEFVSATGENTTENNVVKWDLNKNAKDGSTNQYTFTLTLKPLKDDIIIKNKVYANAVGGTIVGPAGNSILEIFKASSQNSGIPLPMLLAIAKQEGGRALGYSDEEVAQFNTQNWFAGLVDNAPGKTPANNDPLIIRGLAYNTCQYAECAPGADVRGIMQFELGTWNGATKDLHFEDGHTPDRRYITDMIYGAGIHMRNVSQGLESEYHFSSNPTDWNEQQVKVIARIYCGGYGAKNRDLSTDPACRAQDANGNYVAYDTLVWQWYQEFRGTQ